MSNMIQKSSSNLSTNTSPTGDVFSTNVKDTPWVVRLIQGILASFSDVSVNDLIKNLKEKTFQKYVNGVSITWTMILVYYCVVFTMLFLTPLTVLLLLLPCSLLLSTSIRLHLSQTKIKNKSISSRTR